MEDCDRKKEEEEETEAGLEMGATTEVGPKKKLKPRMNGGSSRLEKKGRKLGRRAV